MTRLPPEMYTHQNLNSLALTILQLLLVLAFSSKKFWHHITLAITPF